MSYDRNMLDVRAIDIDSCDRRFLPHFRKTSPVTARTVIWGASVLLCCAALFAPAHANVDPDTTRIGGVTYRFPPDVFMDGVVQTGPRSDFLLELAWPDMRGLTESEQFGWPQPLTIRILAVSGGSPAGAALSVDALSDDFKQELSIAISVDGAIRGNVRLPPTPATEPSVGAVPGAGITKINSEPLLDGRQHDVFVKNPISDPIEFVECDRSDSLLTNPLCDQNFVTNNLTIKVTYVRALVPEWLAIHREVVQFLDKYEVKQ